MKDFNLTEWALEHRAVVLFLIIVVSIAGIFSFSKLGQLEDPKFSVPSMTATVIWPGAGAQQIQVSFELPGDRVRYAGSDCNPGAVSGSSLLSAPLAVVSKLLPLDS